MFCPLCKAEYREGIVRCLDCGVGLVVALEEVGEDPPEVVWRGGDPVAFSRVLDALSNAGIEYHVSSIHNHLAFELGMPRPFYEVRVTRSRLGEALALAGPIVDPLPLAPLKEDAIEPAETEKKDSPEKSSSG